MSNPFIVNVPTLTSNPNPPIQIVNNPPPPLIKNYSISQTSLNNNSTYFSNNFVNAVTSVNTLQNAVTISSTNPNLTVAEVGNDIQLTVLAGGIGVETLNNLDGAVTISSTTPNLTVAEVGNDIQLSLQAVDTLNTLNGGVTISSTNGNLTVAEVGNDIQLTVLAGGIGVESLESLAGNIALTSTGNTVTITTVGQNINLEAVAPVGGVSSLKSLTGAVDITSTGGTVGVTVVGQNINLETLGITPVSDWANFPAINTVNIPDQDFNITTSTPGLAYSKAVINADLDIGTLANAPLRPDLNAYCGTVTFGGITSPLTAMNINSVGSVSVTSALGVSITGGGGVAVTGGGAVTVNSVGGVLVDGGGAISINGVGGISIVGGGALSIASGGILVSAGGVAVNGGGVAINAGGLNVLAGATAIGSAGLAGGGLNIYGSDLSLLPVGAFTSSLKTDLITSQSGSPTLAISNVATINGVVYPPPSGGGVDINGLLNKINAFPVLPYTTSSSSTPAVNQTATAIVPDATPPVNVPTVGAVQGGWGFSKASGSGATFNWYMYNPRFGAPSAPLPYIKSKIQSAWALIRPTVNLYSAGYLGLNLYTFDDANPPTSGFFNTRWAYSNSVGAVAGASGVNLFAGYTYLIYANDVPRITNTSAIGVPDSQISSLRDPYDIYTDVNHIALSNCVVAFNPWTNGTNYQTWTPTGVYVATNTVVFAGFGTNYNGLFFIATGIPVVGVAPMVNGVVSANWALINPQPSSFADQPVSLININQSSASGQAVGYVVLDIGFSYGPTTTSTTVSQHISLLPN